MSSEPPDLLFMVTRLSIHRASRRTPEETPGASQCTSKSHKVSDVDCRCYCVRSNCRKKRATRLHCKEHAITIRRYIVCFQENGTHKHRLWNRDILAALNIGTLCLGRALQISDLGPWSYSVKRGDLKNSAKAWTEIFRDHGGAPFSLPTPYDEERSHYYIQQHKQRCVIS